MKKSYPKILDSKYAELFASPSMLPSTSKSNFEVRDLNIKVIFNCKNRNALWYKEYLIEKVADNNPSDDQWFEVTGCPDGKFEFAKRDDSYGYGQESYLDPKGNIVYRVDLRGKLKVGTETKIIISFITANHEAEDKLLDMESSIHFKKYLFRYDFGYSVKVDQFTYTVEVENGNIISAWPRGNGLSKVEDNLRAIFIKNDGLRPKEIFTPLIQIEYGSKSLSTLYKNRGAVLIGVCTSLIASGIIYLVQHPVS